MMIVRIAPQIEDLIIESYYCNYQFRTHDRNYTFEAPIILEVRNDLEMSILHARINAAISHAFVLTSADEPVSIDEHKKSTLMGQNVLLDDTDPKINMNFIIDEDNINRDMDVEPIKLNVKVVSVKTPKEAHGKIINAIDDIKHLFRFEIPTNGLK
ncbi:hypothetical protein GWA97_09605 [Flavobacterium sp. LaA7.5]|nr:hypothetical protein [Flavobacterium salilacus subsp. altitudinum]